MNKYEKVIAYIERCGFLGTFAEQIDKCIKDLEETGMGDNWNPPPRQKLLEQAYKIKEEIK